MMVETPGTSSNMKAALRGVEYIAQHIKNQDKDNEVSFFEIFPKSFFKISKIDQNTRFNVCLLDDFVVHLVQKACECIKIFAS